MMHLINQTGFQAIALPTVCHEDEHHIVVIVKGTFNIGNAEQGLIVADHQSEINLADVYWGKPGEFSLKYESDIAISKPGTDVALIGKARSPNGPVRQLDVRLSVGALQKVVRVFGDRFWEKTASGWKMTSPKPFESMPLVYEYAYGGQDPWQEPDAPPDVELRNPVGKGFAGKKSHKAVDRIPLPNLELPQQLISDIRQRPEPAGFGFIARNWQPRSLMMGTYDEAWEAHRSPLLPADFNPASHAAASPGLRADHHFEGGEPVVIENVSSQGPINFSLPENRIKVVTYIDQQRVEHETLMDTVVIESLRNRVILTWRVAITCHWNLFKVEWIKVLESN